MTGARLVWHQFRYDQKTFWRDRTAVFFTAALPLIFLLLLVTILGNEEVTVDGGREIKGSTYYVPAILALQLVSATFVNLAISLTVLREQGLLKRIRKTPMPGWVFIAGRVATCIVVVVVMTVLVVALGRILYGVQVPTSTAPGALLTLVVGSAVFCVLGFAVTGLIPTSNASSPVTNAIVLPLYFASGIFIQDEAIPSFLQRIADVFPVKHLYQALLAAFADTGGSGFEPFHLAVMAAWGVAGLAVALRTFRWVPMSS